MSRYLLALAGLELALAAAPATATIIVYDTPGAIQPAENVLFQGTPPSGNNAFGVTNQTNTAVTFTGIEALSTPSMGQARIEAADGGLSQLSFALTDPALGFKQVEFNIFGTQATATSVQLSFFDQFGNTFGGTYNIVSGQNFFSAQALDDQFITNVSVLLNGNVKDIRQFRIGGIAGIVDGGGTGSTVPEPENWALLIAGFGLVGASARRRRTIPAVTA